MLLSRDQPSDGARIAMLAFSAGGHSCGIAVDAVECVVDVVAIDPVPGAPRAVLGVINFHGTIVPVVDPRRRFGGKGGEIDCSQKLIIVKTPSRLIALLADNVEHIDWISPSQVTTVEDFVPGACRITGTVASAHGLILIHDAELLLTRAEERCLETSLRSKPE